MNFKTWYTSLQLTERHRFAQAIGTSHGYLNLVAYGYKYISLGLADAIVSGSGGRVTHDGLPLNERAQKQLALRANGVQVDFREPLPDDRAALERELDRLIQGRGRGRRRGQGRRSLSVPGVPGMLTDYAD